MPVLQVETNLTADQLLQAARQLPATELNEFVRSVNRLRPAPEAPRLSPQETALLLKINQAIPANLQKSYDTLYRKWRRGAASEAEQQKLHRLNQQIEAANAERFSRLAELAQLRQKPLRVLLDELGIRPPTND